VGKNEKLNLERYYWKNNKCRLWNFCWVSLLENGSSLWSGRRHWFSTIRRLDPQ